MSKVIEAKWTTAKEIEYLRKIGTYCVDFHMSRLTRAQYLKKYIKAINLRVNWGCISKKDVLFAATEMLQKC